MPKILSEFFDRAVETVFPSREALKTTLASKKLKIYIGIDPTAPDLHLGHSTNFLLLKQFQEQGHKIILLVGDFTATIGDPSERAVGRKPLTKAEISKNLKTYKKQVAKILKFTGSNPAEFKFNSQWLGNLTPQQVIELASTTTVQQLLERDMFQKRIKAGNPISVHEFLYPLFQGYDSVALDVDAEVGGTDQTFNMLVGRQLLKKYKNKEKFVITTKLLINPKTGQKLMSKSEGNYISIQDTPDNMYGKVMALPDEVVFECLKLCTLLSNSQIGEIKKLKIVDAKKLLARELVKLYFSEKTAKSVALEFEKIFQKREIPQRVPIFRPKGNNYKIINLLVESRLVSSNSEAKRLIEQGAVEVNKIKISNPETIIKAGDTIKIGKYKFLKIG